MISYYFNATLITSGVSNGVLTLNNVTTANAGPYQCFADNVRADHSALWVVTVRDPCEYKLYLYFVINTIVSVKFMVGNFHVQSFDSQTPENRLTDLMPQ